MTEVDSPDRHTDPPDMHFGSGLAALERKLELWSALRRTSRYERHREPASQSTRQQDRLARPVPRLVPSA
jgi:hypothetical protein